MNKIIFIIFAVFLLTSCETVSALLDGSKNTIKKDQNRISVLGESGGGAVIDKSMKYIPILVSEQKTSKRWYSSSGQNIFTPENPILPKAFSKRVIAKIGKGGSKGLHLSSTPIVANGKVFTIGSDGLVTAFNAENIKKTIWEYKIETEVGEGSFHNAGVSYFEGKIYIATGYNVVIALDSSNGTLVWQRKINSMARSAPASNGDIVVVNTIDNRSYALSAEDGGILWIHSGFEDEISSLGSASPVLYKGMVFVPYSSGALYALNQEDGSQIWFKNLNLGSASSAHYLSDIDAAPVIRDNIIYVISNNGSLAALDVFSGEKKWDVEISSNKPIWYAGSFLFVLDKHNNVLAVNAKTGGIKWKTELKSYKKPKLKIGSIYWNGPVLAGDVIWVVNSKARLLAISPQTGAIVSRHKVLGNVFLPPIVAHGRMYLLNDNAKLIAMDNSNKHKPTRYFFNSEGDVKKGWF